MGAFAIAGADFKTSFGRCGVSALTAAGAAVLAGDLAGIALFLASAGLAALAAGLAALAALAAGLADVLTIGFAVTLGAETVALAAALTVTGFVLSAVTGFADALAGFDFRALTDLAGALTAVLAFLTGFATGFSALDTGLIAGLAGALSATFLTALATGLALTAAFGTTFLTATLTVDLLDFFTSCLLAVRAYAHQVRQPIALNALRSFASKPMGWTFWGGGRRNKAPCQGGDCSDRTSQKGEWSVLNSQLS